MLNVSITTHTPSIEKCGQIISYENIFKIKLPKLGYQIRTALGILELPSSMINSSKTSVNCESLDNENIINSPHIFSLKPPSNDDILQHQTVESKSSIQKNGLDTDISEDTPVELSTSQQDLLDRTVIPLEIPPVEVSFEMSVSLTDQSAQVRWY